MKRHATLAIGMKEYHVDRVIARIESADLEETLREKNIEVFSDFRASKSLLRSLIESPNVVHLLTNQDQALYEIRLLNSRYEGMTLREFPFTGDVLLSVFSAGTIQLFRMAIRNFCSMIA